VEVLKLKKGGIDSQLREKEEGTKKRRERSVLLRKTRKSTQGGEKKPRKCRKLREWDASVMKERGLGNLGGIFEAFQSPKKPIIAKKKLR